jgi:hypothetical protein
VVIDAGEFLLYNGYWINRLETTYTGCEIVRTFLRYALIAGGIYGALVLYHFQLGAIPFFLLSFYLFYEAYKVIRYREREESEENSSLLNSQK